MLLSLLLLLCPQTSPHFLSSSLHRLKEIGEELEEDLEEKEMRRARREAAREEKMATLPPKLGPHKWAIFHLNSCREFLIVPPSDLKLTQLKCFSQRK